MKMKTNPNDFINISIDRNTDLDCGLTKREYFAAMAMQGYCANKQIVSSYHTDLKELQWNELVAVCALEVADALIEELNKEK